ncbi:MAG: hypothetical protein JST39_14250, partial [Bacteroidetes bacterium]|nr:hypothetical protein [Bacteroidota bacterium]
MKKLLSIALFLLAFTGEGVAQMRDTTALPLLRRILEIEFFRSNTGEKVAKLARLQQDFPDRDSGKIAEQYDALRSDIAMDYLKNGQPAEIEPWLKKIHTAEGKCNAASKLGEYMLKQDVKKYAPLVEERVRPQVDSLYAIFKTDRPSRELYMRLMPVYIKALVQ